MPTLVGLIGLPFAQVLKREANGVSEMTQRIAFDTEGRAWALVVRMVKLPDELRQRRPLGAAFARLSFARWQLVNPIPFVTDSPIDVFDKPDPEGWPIEGPKT